MEVNELLENARECISRGIEYKRIGEFGNAINSCSEAVSYIEKIMDSDNAGEAEIRESLCLKNKSLALIDQMQEILSFVNTDLMNP